ncbi:hypothetical protein OGM63_21380 [Plectonema radiosum NIES-515]|uniref:Uncharacterized protein n=1 Tax=Plectonema radiosum NIES-515 TaxID=2986073 RepID=A0ABT3B4Z2_9CYAN|nr:hypothetical protein [Plectonema radiosum]MCV3216030.1 hypothetical protein [Plectonema radiosum NIES-515]
MGLADITFEILESVAVRKALNKTGKRIFKTSFEDKQTDDKGGILGWVWNSAKRLTGFIFQSVGNFLSFSLTSLWGFFTSTLQYLWNFNWNITDKEIDTQIQAKWDALGSMLGGTLGSFVGYLGCGVLPAATIFAFNEPLGAHIMANVSEELVDEFSENLGSLIRYTFVSGTQALILSSFKNARKFIKSNQALAQSLFGGDTSKIIKAWGAEDSKPWSFALKLEETVEAIPNTFVRNFVEEFLEESWEGCVEAGYVVANSIDSYMAAEKFKQQQLPIFGKDKYVEVLPNRENKEEKIILAGSTELLKPIIVQTLASHQLMGNKDIGTVYNFTPEKVQNIRSYQPQVEIKFLQLYAEKEKDKEQLKGQISFRLTDKKAETITNEDILTLAQKIKAKFATPPFVWKKGKLLVSYSDWSKGYQFQLLVASKNEAKRIIEQVLDLQGHSPQWEFMNVVQNEAPEKSFDETPKNKIILGKEEKQPTKRREGNVRFQYAQIFLCGREKPITLCDLSHRWRDPIVKVDKDKN